MTAKTMQSAPHATTFHPSSKPMPTKSAPVRSFTVLRNDDRAERLSVLRSLRRRADWAFSTAVHAYAHARGRGPSVEPRHAA